VGRAPAGAPPQMVRAALCAIRIQPSLPVGTALPRQRLKRLSGSPPEPRPRRRSPNRSCGAQIACSFRRSSPSSRSKSRAVRSSHALDVHAGHLNFRDAPDRKTCCGCQRSRPAKIVPGISLRLPERLECGTSSQSGDRHEAPDSAHEGFCPVRSPLHGALDALVVTYRAPRSGSTSTRRSEALEGPSMPMD